MITIALLLLQATAGGAPTPAAQATPRADWVARPDWRDLLRCARAAPKPPPEAVVTLRCVTAAHDQITDCAVVSNTRAPDARYERAALCATKYFRIRAGPADAPVLGVPVTVPTGFITPSTSAAMIKAARAGRWPRPAEGAVDEVILIQGQP